MSPYAMLSEVTRLLGVAYSGNLNLTPAADVYHTIYPVKGNERQGPARQTWAMTYAYVPGVATFGELPELPLLPMVLREPWVFLATP